MPFSRSAACSSVCPCSERCPLAEVVSAIGGKWKMRILCSLTADGALRYSDLKQKTAGITPAVLSSTLKEMEQSGLITRTEYDEVPARVEYSLTEHGRELWPILHRLVHWVRREPFDGDHAVDQIHNAEETDVR